MTVPNQFGTATSAIPLSQLDANFNTPITLGNTAIQLGDTVTTLNNMTLANVTISSGTITITNVSVTTANVSGTANVSTLVVVGNETVGGNTTITGNITAANANVTSNLVLFGGTANGVAYLNTSKQVTTGTALVFDGSNLGLGVTPSAWSGNKALQVNARTSLYSSADGGAVVGNNLYYNGTNNIYVASSYANAYQQNASGQHIWFNAPSGTANAAVTFIQAMTLDASGNLGLGVGTTSPNSKLQVNSGTNLGGVLIGFNGTSANFYDADSQYWRTGNGTGRMTLDSSGNLGLGVTPSANAGQSTLNISNYNRTLSALTMGSNGNSAGYVGYNMGNTSTADLYRYIASDTGSVIYFAGNEMRFMQFASGSAGATTNGTQAITLDASGNLLVGTTAPGVTNTKSIISDLGADGYLIVNHSGAASGSGYQYFGYNGGVVGSITQNGTTGVLYNLTSDYRLKNEQEALTGAKDFIMALKPKKWQWWDGSGEGVGFVAHEFMEVAKYSGNGEKDAIDADGKPVYQSIQPSSSEVMANLVSFIQEQQALITTLTARITALEGA